jgi:hypothetical protein
VSHLFSLALFQSYISVLSSRPSMTIARSSIGNCCAIHRRAMKILRSPLVARRRWPVSTAVCTSSAGRSEARALRSSLCDDVAGPGRKQNTHNALGRRCSWQLSDEHLEAATQTLPFIRNMRAMFPSFRCGVLRTCDGNQTSISPVSQTCTYVLVKEAKHCALACDVSVLCRCRTAAVLESGRP